MYTYPNYLEAHLKRCPMLVCTKLWECPHCGRKYSSEDYLDVHIKTDCKKKPGLKILKADNPTVSGMHSEEACLWAKASL
jgi:hypothetical protein